MKFILALSAVFALSAGSVYAEPGQVSSSSVAQAQLKANNVDLSKAPPTLTDEQKKSIIIAAQAVENLELKAQVIAGQLQKARADMDTLLGSLIPAGYRVNEKLELVKAPVEPGKPGGNQ